MVCLLLRPQQIPHGALELGWPFNSVPNGGRGTRFLCHSISRRPRLFLQERWCSLAQDSSLGPKAVPGEGLGCETSTARIPRGWGVGVVALKRRGNGQSMEVRTLSSYEELQTH